MLVRGSQVPFGYASGSKVSAIIDRQSMFTFKLENSFEFLSYFAENLKFMYHLVETEVYLGYDIKSDVCETLDEEQINDSNLRD